MLLCWWLLWLPGLVTAQTNDATQSLLWKIAGKGLQPSYLFGTIHAVCPQDFSIPEQVKASLQQTSQLALEIDMDAPNFAAELLQSAMLPPDQSLESFFSAADYQLLAAHFQQSMGIDIQYLNKMKPFMLQSLLFSELTDCPAESYEQHLVEMAHAQGKEVIGVETVQEQLQAMDHLPSNAQADMLLKTLKDMAEAKADYRKMVQLYLAQDLQGLAKLSEAEMDTATYAQYEQAFLTDRNKRWVPVIEREAKARSTFFAVGAGHLAGEKGLLHLLRQQGYTVTPLK